MNKLIEAHPVEIPQTLLQRQTYRMLEATMREMVAHGVDPRNAGIDGQALFARVEREARRQLHGSLLLEHIAEQETIEPTDEEVEAEIAALARASNQPIEQVRATLTKEGAESSIADGLRTRKALNFVVENARVSTEEWREEEVEENLPATAAPPAEEAEGEATGEAAERDSGERQTEETAGTQESSEASPQGAT